MADELLMQRYHISIHPPLAGRDRALCVPTFCGNHFNPPAPCGAGLHTIRYTYRGDHFNPPAPCGAGRDRASPEGRQTDFNPPAPCGAGPPLLPLLPQLFPISIHPPLAGRDPRCCRCCPSCFQFQSTRPLRGGTAPSSFGGACPVFQSTRPLRGGTSISRM